MNSSYMRLVPRDGYEAAVESDLPLPLPQHRLAAHARRALVEVRGWLMREQRGDGAWCSRTDGDNARYSQYILVLAFLGEADSPRAAGAARALIQRQLPSGGWSRSPGGPMEISASVQAYFALKLAGQEPHTEPMQRAREAILAAGGARGADAVTRYYLAMLGQVPYETLAVIGACRPVTPVDPRRGVRELFLTHPREWPDVTLNVATDDGDEGLASLLWRLIALKGSTDADANRAIGACREQIENLVIAEDDQVRLQPLQFPLRDTAIALRALLEAGVRPEDESMARAAAWLDEQKIDEQSSCSNDAASLLLALTQLTEERSNDYLPAGLQLRVEAVDRPCKVRKSAARMKRISDLAASMEGRMLEPQASSAPDATGRLLEALGILGRRVGDPAVDRAIASLRQSQEPDGSWHGDGGVNHIHGTWQVLAGLAAVGLSPDDPLIASGADWLLAWQQACGGWGETAASYDDPRLRGQGPVTASQTSWALLGLMAAGLADHAAVTRGVRFLVSEQSDDGAWHEPEFTAAGTGGAFRSDLYRGHFPLLALSHWLQVSSGK